MSDPHKKDRPPKDKAPPSGKSRDAIKSATEPAQTRAKSRELEATFGPSKVTMRSPPLKLVKSPKANKTPNRPINASSPATSGGRKNKENSESDAIMSGRGGSSPAHGGRVAASPSANGLTRRSPQKSPRALTKQNVDIRQAIMIILKIINLPSHINTIKTLNNRLRCSGIHVEPGTLRINEQMNSATFKTKNIDAMRVQHTLRTDSGHNDIRVEILKSRVRAPALPRTRATFSVVVKGVHPDFTDEEVVAELREQKLNITKAWRIRSRETGQLTMLVRVLTECQETTDKLLRDGAILANGRHMVEASHLPKPQPMQCGRCFAFGHQAASCKRKEQTCPKCGQIRDQEHSCVVTRCLACGGDHEAWSNKCPKRPINPAPEQTAPLKCSNLPYKVENPLPVAVDELATTVDAIRFTAMVLSNLFPEKRDKIMEVICRFSLQFYQLKVVATGSGGGIHLSTSRILTNPIP